LLGEIIDTLIPADARTQMPSATDAGIEFVLRAGPKAAMVQDYLALAEVVLSARSGVESGRAEGSFFQLSPQQRLEVLNATRTKNAPLFVAFVTALFQAYFTCPSVLTRVGSGAVPPFPQGNLLLTNDWSILDPVFRLGRVYREVEA